MSCITELKCSAVDFASPSCTKSNLSWPYNRMRVNSTNSVESYEHSATVVLPSFSQSTISQRRLVTQSTDANVRNLAVPKAGLKIKYLRSSVSLTRSMSASRNGDDSSLTLLAHTANCSTEPMSLYLHALHCKVGVISPFKKTVFSATQKTANSIAALILRVFLFVGKRNFTTTSSLLTFWAGYRMQTLLSKRMVSPTTDSTRAKAAHRLREPVRPPSTIRYAFRTKFSLITHRKSLILREWRFSGASEACRTFENPNGAISDASVDRACNQLLPRARAWRDRYQSWRQRQAEMLRSFPGCRPTQRQRVSRLRP
jgi:hypothetical protein